MSERMGHDLVPGCEFTDSPFDATSAKYLREPMLSTYALAIDCAGHLYSIRGGAAGSATRGTTVAHILRQLSQQGNAPRP